MIKAISGIKIKGANFSNETSLNLFDNTGDKLSEYYSAAEPPVRCGMSHLSGLTEPPYQ